MEVFVMREEPDEPYPCLACADTTNAQYTYDLEQLRFHFEGEYKDEELHQAFNPFKELSIDDLTNSLNCTIKRDKVSKGITFLNMLNSQTEDEQFNIMYSAESSTGKSYIPMEISRYFPEKQVVELAGASPTSMIHESGVLCLDQDGKYTPIDDLIEPIQEEIEEMEFSGKRLDYEQNRHLNQLKKRIYLIRKNAKTIIDYEGKILIIIDQRDPKLLERIRPFLSHDKKQLEFRITTNSKQGNKTQHIILMGFSSVHFCTTNARYDDQEATRNFVLSPESDPDKIKESLELLNDKLADRASYDKWLDNQPERKALMFRIMLIQALGVKRFRIWDKAKVLEGFNALHKGRFISRYSRDLTRIYSLIYGCALLNCFNRELDSEILIATEADMNSAFALYAEIMEANESGVPPEIYNMYKDIFVPYFNRQETGFMGMSVKDMHKAIFQKQFRHVSNERMVKDIVPALLASNLLEETRGEDKRIPLYVPSLNINSIPHDTKLDGLLVP